MLSRELRQSVRRSIRHQVASSAGITLVLASGIWLSVVVFNVLNAVVLRSLPYPDAARVVEIVSENPEEGEFAGALTALEASEALRDVPGFETTAYYGWGAFTFTGDGPPQLIETSLVSADYFSVFGLEAALGRTLIPSDIEESPSVAVLNHAAWVQLTGAAEDAVGQMLRFQDLQFELVGVLPDSFSHPTVAPHIYVPMPTILVSPDVPGYADARLFSAVGRLSEIASASQADAGLQIRQNAAAAGFGENAEGWVLRQHPLLDQLLGNTRNVLAALFVLACCVLLVACAAAASLASIRMDSRVKELAVRRTLGATNAQVALSVFSEFIVLVVIAFLLAIFLVDATLGALAPVLDGILPRADSLRLDWESFLFASGITLVTALLACVPALSRVLRVSASEELRVSQNSEVTWRSHSAFIPIVGIGLSAVALTSALALTISLSRISNVELGFRTESIAAIQIFRPRADVPQFVETAFDELRSIAGVRGVSAVRSTPMDRGARFSMTVAPGHSVQDTMTADVQRAAPGYHSFLNIPLIRGRDISEIDGSDAAKVAVINRTLAERLFGADDPVGQQLVLYMDDMPVAFEVVGLVEDTRNAGIRAPSNPEVVVPIAQFPQWPYSITLLVDSGLPPIDLIPEFEAAVFRTDPQQPINRSYTLSEEVRSQTKQSLLFSQLTNGFAVLAVFLGTFGLYAVLSSMVAQRKREIGLRMALGATRGSASKLVLTTALRFVAYGAGVGLMLSIPVLRSFGSELFRISQVSYVAIFGATVVLLLLAGFIASSASAWRASRIEPMVILRDE